jgi:hypothetical protein
MREVQSKSDFNEADCLAGGLIVHCAITWSRSPPPRGVNQRMRTARQEAHPSRLQALEQLANRPEGGARFVMCLPLVARPLRVHPESKRTEVDVPAGRTLGTHRPRGMGCRWRGSGLSSKKSRYDSHLTQGATP